MQVVLVEPGKAARITEIGEDLQDILTPDMRHSHRIAESSACGISLSIMNTLPERRSRRKTAKEKNRSVEKESL